MMLLKKLVIFSVNYLVLMGILFSYQTHASEKSWTRVLKVTQSKNDRSAKASLDKLIKDKHSPVDLDRLYLTRARWYYQNNKFNEAIADYSKLTKGTDYWLLALEERAWAHLRLDDTNQALAQLKTLLNDLLAPQVGPEPYLLATLIKLKVCDYLGVFKEIKQFKEKYKERTTLIQKLADGHDTEYSNKVVEMISQGQLDWIPLKRDVQYLPLLFHRDKKLNELAKQAKKRQSTSIATQAKSRLVELAKRDLKDISRILNKLHLVEVEAIQRVYIAENSPDGRAKFNNEPKGETLNFPYNGEVWLDELDNYQVATKSCKGFGGKAL